MRLSKPRLEPLDPDSAEGVAKEQLARAAERGRVLNITRTLAHYPELSSAWGQFSRHVLGNSSLPDRERELIILRMGWNCRSGYEFGQHRRIGQAAGLTLEEVERTKQGPEADGWTDHERALLTAADELHGDALPLGRHLGRALGAVQHPAVDGRRVHGRPVQPRLDGAQHPRRAARARHPRPRARRLTTGLSHARTT